MSKCSLCGQIQGFEKSALRTAIINGLRNCFKDHGPITDQFYTSAAKRIITGLENLGVDVIKRMD